jgi:hypothetical protein
VDTISQRWQRATTSFGWAWNSAFSRGETYEPTPLGRAFSTDGVRGYYVDYTRKTSAAAAAAPERLDSITLIQLALGWWEGCLGAPGPAADHFLHACELALARAEPHENALFWPVTVPVAKYGLRPPWTSALVQGQAASVLVRAHQLTGDERWVAAARAAVAPLLTSRGALVTSTNCGPILEEAPSTPASHILNGWISALWGVRDVAVGHDDSRALAVYEASIETLCAHLPAYDTGWWTRYSLYPHPVEDLAKPIYQRFHADQLDVRHQLTGIAQFKTTAARWRGYDRPGAAAAAVVQKAVFVAVDSRRRRRRPRLGPDGR